jgi:hypothetical protein
MRIGNAGRQRLGSGPLSVEQRLGAGYHLSVDGSGPKPRRALSISVAGRDGARLSRSMPFRRAVRVKHEIKAVAVPYRPGVLIGQILDKTPGPPSRPALN